MNKNLDKRTFTNLLGFLLGMGVECIDSAFYEENDQGEFVTVVMENKSRYTFDVTGDSNVALAYDVVRGIKEHC